MKTRVISATVLIILVVACFALGPVTRALFLLAAMIMAVWETCRAIGYKNVVCQPWILYAYCVATVAELWFNADALAFEITFFLAVFAAMTAGIVSKKIRGAVIAGGIRDTKQILEQNFPIFYRYRTSNGSLGRCMITHYQVPVKIGKVTVRPGDIIFGDIDGVLCIPREIAYDVLLRAEAIQRNEVDIFDWVHSGDTIQEIIAKGGYF